MQHCFSVPLQLLLFTLCPVMKVCLVHFTLRYSKESVCVRACVPALFVSYSIQQSPVMDNELHKHSYLVRQVKYACVKELFKLLQKAALYQNKRRQGKTRAATSARVFMAFTTLNVWFRLSLVSILVFITTITKLVVKEQLRITVHIHRYHHNTYLD